MIDIVREVEAVQREVGRGRISGDYRVGGRFQFEGTAGGDIVATE